jgi:uncharacterized protein YkwD
MLRPSRALAASLATAFTCLLAGAGFSPALAAHPSAHGAVVHRFTVHARCAGSGPARTRSTRRGPREPIAHMALSSRHGSSSAHRAGCAASVHSSDRHSRRAARHHRAHPADSGSGAGASAAAGSTGPLVLTPQDGSCPDAALEPADTNIELVRAATLCLVNRERADNGEQPLRWNASLCRAAQAHTESMAWGDYFEHTGPDGQTPLARMRATGYISSSRNGYEVGENIGYGTLRLGTPRAVVAAWMASPGHRANILDARFRDTGIGVSPHPPGSLSGGQSGGIYTQDFGVVIPG